MFSHTYLFSAALTAVLLGPVLAQQDVPPLAEAPSPEQQLRNEQRQRRSRQIYLRRQGLAAFADPAVQSQLNLTGQQFHQLQHLWQQTQGQPQNLRRSPRPTPVEQVIGREYSGWVAVVRHLSEGQEGPSLEDAVPTNKSRP